MIEIVSLGCAVLEQTTETLPSGATVTLLLKTYNWLRRRYLGLVFEIVGMLRDNAKSNLVNKNTEISLVVILYVLPVSCIQMLI